MLPRPPPSKQDGGQHTLPAHISILESGIKYETCSGMIEKKDPQSETFLSLLREENISRRILTVRGHSVILDEEVVTKCDHLSRLKFSPVLPFAYTRRCGGGSDSGLFSVFPGSKSGG